jgi:N-acyl-D-amino-acid deacylase
MLGLPLIVLGLVQSPSLLIRGGTVIDGTGEKPWVADVRVVGDRITEVGLLERREGETVIEAKGLVVAPGFIDAHSHADGEILIKPAATTAIRQGITTAIVGQDGGSAFPLSDFRKQLESRPPALNLASFVGHGTVRRKAMTGDGKRKATPEEVAKMVAMVDEEMKAGALGLSSGLEYDPGFYATTDEVVSVAKVAAGHGGMYISHVRDEENEALESFEEAIKVAEQARLPGQISHIKLGSAPVWGKASTVLRMMSDARKRKLDVTADVYPYRYWQSTITVITPTRDWADRKAWQKGLEEIGGPEHVLLTTFSPDRSWQGKTIAELAKSQNKDAVTVIQDIVARTKGERGNGAESVVVTAMTEEDLTAFIQDPNVMFCSDGGLTPSHPRGAGSFPRILGVYVREKKALSLEEAVRKMTSLAARRFGLKDRGLVEAGKFADLVLFDPATVKDTATVAAPMAPPVGVQYVIVNGQVAVSPTGPTKSRVGRFLAFQRRGS